MANRARAWQWAIYLSQFVIQITSYATICSLMYAVSRPCVTLCSVSDSYGQRSAQIVTSGTHALLSYRQTPTEVEHPCRSFVAVVSSNGTSCAAIAMRRAGAPSPFTPRTRRPTSRSCLLTTLPISCIAVSTVEART
eukprot:4448879-Pleurochrysis_carterae.AAC.1